MPFPRELANAQRTSMHEELVRIYRELAEIRLNLGEPPHLFNLTAADAGTIRGLLADAMEPLQKAERIARP